jgi:hypothetical protein
VGGFFVIVSLWNPDSFDERPAEAPEVLSRALRASAIVLWWLVPIALIFGFGLFKEAYLKFLLIGSPAFCILLARGIDNALGIARNALAMPRELAGQPMLNWAWSLVVSVLIILMAVSTAASLQNYYFDPKYARDDYRGLAQTIMKNQRAGDAILLDAANQWEVFTYYYPDGPNIFPLPKQRPLDQTAVESELNDITSKYRRLFVLYWGDGEADPQRVIETWLEAHTYKAAEQWVGSIRFATYAVPAQLSNEPARYSRLRFGEHITLDGYTLLATKLRPGDILQIDLWWRTDARLNDRYKVFVHVLDVKGTIVAQTDREPGVGLNPTTNWRPNEPIVDRYGVLIPVDVPDGSYMVEVGLYDLNNTRLKIEGNGDALVVAKVDIMSEK